MNALVPMLVSPSGSVIVRSDEQSLNAALPIRLTFSGMRMELSAVQLLNA
jgi:hypothetical protein